MYIAETFLSLALINYHTLLWRYIMVARSISINLVCFYHHDIVIVRLPPSWRVLSVDATLCNKVCRWPVDSGVFSLLVLRIPLQIKLPATFVSETSLKVALNASNTNIIPTIPPVLRSLYIIVNIIKQLQVKQRWNRREKGDKFEHHLYISICYGYMCTYVDMTNSAAWFIL